MSLSLLLKYGQNYLVYPEAFPVIHMEERHLRIPATIGLPGGEVDIITADECKLRCYHIPCENAIATVIVCHGNAMNHGDLLEPIVQHLFRLKCNVLTLSYRGYGRSNGTPTEAGLKKDSQAALDYVRNTPGLAAVPTVVYGLSLGGAVAIDLTARNPNEVSALIVENTFLSLPAIVRDWQYIGTFSFLCHQKWNSSQSIRLVSPSIPILFLSGLMDKVVPKKHMQALWEIASQRHVPPEESILSSIASKFIPSSSASEVRGDPPKPNGKDKLVTFPRGSHASTMIQPQYWETIQEFLDTTVR